MAATAGGAGTAAATGGAGAAVFGAAAAAGKARAKRIAAATARPKNPTFFIHSSLCRVSNRRAEPHAPRPVSSRPYVPECVQPDYPPMSLPRCLTFDVATT